MGQAYDSLPYAADVCPQFNSPEQLFNWLKMRIIFREDPEGIELLQTMPTMFEKNWHGIPGAGDCDCFVITSIACLKVNGFDDIQIVLSSGNKRMPSHIYMAVLDGDRWKAFDLTNRYYGEERSYPFRQLLRI